MSTRSVLMILPLSIFIVLIVALWNGRVVNTTVLIQAGHVGRVAGNIGSIHNGLVESEWNERVAIRVEDILKKNGVITTRVGAKIPTTNATMAISIHFDGSNNHCATGASIGHDGSAASKVLAKRWRAEYSKFFPFKWHKDNFTKNLSDYYGYSKVTTTKGFLVLELGEITCQEQTDWLEPRLGDVAAKVAYFILKELKR
ncbi:MAG TPA: N-acetylmuramoyl-L-alanine amidase [Campylobacterales bacterium]|nr:N-acetylmuramoyl-L-alanine amidase [Campylobacterales bacterium]HHS92318.1 N-acetylmuramoyl-L-alanine amidase [Campylobacterales bacterium]